MVKANVTRCNHQTSVSNKEEKVEMEKQQLQHIFASPATFEQRCKIKDGHHLSVVAEVACEDKPGEENGRPGKDRPR